MTSPDYNRFSDVGTDARTQIVFVLHFSSRSIALRCCEINGFLLAAWCMRECVRASRSDNHTAYCVLWLVEFGLSDFGALPALVRSTSTSQKLVAAAVLGSRIIGHSLSRWPRCSPPLHGHGKRRKMTE